ncbi:MAG TPA: beta-propeller fold lactonase family protein [Blastocatellia bacterium]|nr:beta-propeller fold lactonase family protein [Blastocatellia bacterium]
MKRVSKVVLSIAILFAFCPTKFAQSEFVYLNTGVAVGNSVAAFSLSADAALTEIVGSPFPTGQSGFIDSPILVVGGFLYVGNSNSLNISAFSINPATGSLTAVPNSPFALEGFSYGTIMTLASTPDDRFLMASNVSPGTITVFRIANDGGLVPIAASPFRVGEAIYDMKVSPTGRFLAAALRHRNWILMFRIAVDGTLSAVPGSPFSSNHDFSFANSVEFNCDGTTLFVGNARNGPPLIDAFRVADDGSLSLVQGSPFTTATGTDSAHVLLSQNNQYLFAANFESNTITVFRVTADDSASSVSSKPFKVKDDSPGALGLNRTGTILLSGNFGRNQFRKSISVFSINKEGLLTHVSGSPFDMGERSYLNNSVSIATYPRRNCLLRIDDVSISGKKLFVMGSNFDNGSVILLNGEDQKTSNDEQAWTSLLIGKKAGKRVKAGDRISVKTSTGRLSNEFILNAAQLRKTR